MSKAERRLPQVCYCHRRDRNYRTFRPHEGKFIRNFRLFICWDCVHRQTKQSHRKKTAASSEGERIILHALCLAGKPFKYKFKVGRWEFDFGFLSERLLLEIDGPDHSYGQVRRKDELKQRCAEELGWRVIRVRSGPDIVARASRALTIYGAPVNHSW
jgi:very-short-patch-repair endonuclease